MYPLLSWMPYLNKRIAILVALSEVIGALVGQSVMNSENGGKTRLSTLSSGLSLLLMI